jgi:hypothetical protein
MIITPYFIGAAFAVLVIYLNIAASIGLFRTKDLNRFQKWCQYVIVWLLPYIGARLVLTLLRETDPSSAPRSMLGYRIFGMIETAETRNSAWAGDDSHSTHHHDGSGHDSGTGGHGC